MVTERKIKLVMKENNINKDKHNKQGEPSLQQGTFPR